MVFYTTEENKSKEENLLDKHLFSVMEEKIIEQAGCTKWGQVSTFDMSSPFQNGVTSQHLTYLGERDQLSI